MEHGHLQVASVAGSATLAGIVLIAFGVEALIWIYGAAAMLAGAAVLIVLGRVVRARRGTAGAPVPRRDA